MTDLDKFRGSLIGLAVGDALGAPLEGMRAGHIKDVFGYVRGYVDANKAWQSKPYKYRSFGVYTDDTQQALCLAESLVRCYGFESEDFAKSLLRLWQAKEESKTGAFRGISLTFRKVMEKIANGVGVDKSGEPSAGVGAAMRVGPVGLYFWEDRDELLKAALEQALVTHKDPRALSLSTAIAYSVARSASGAWSELKPRDRCEDLIEFTARAEKMVEEEIIIHLPPLVYDFFGLFYRSIEPFRHWHGMEHELVLRQIVTLANQAFPREKIHSAGQNFALACGVAALFLGVGCKDFESGVLEAINLGRDTDSTGAMTGAILGARLQSGDAVLLKASRGEKLEQVLETLTKEPI